MGLANKDDDVLVAYCAYTAGLSFCCSHVIAILYETEYAALQGPTNTT